MTRISKLVVKETVEELLKLQQAVILPYKKKRLEMLIRTKTGNGITKAELSHTLQVSDKTIQEWRKKYKKGGIEKLLEESRGGDRVGAIHDPKIIKLIQIYIEQTKHPYAVVNIMTWLITEHGYTINQLPPPNSFKYYLFHRYKKMPEMVIR